MRCGMVHWAKSLDYKKHKLRMALGQKLQSDSTWTGPVQREAVDMGTTKTTNTHYNMKEIWKKERYVGIFYTKYRRWWKCEKLNAVQYSIFLRKNSTLTWEFSMRLSCPFHLWYCDKHQKQLSKCGSKLPWMRLFWLRNGTFAEMSHQWRW